MGQNIDQLDTSSSWQLFINCTKSSWICIGTLASQLQNQTTFRAQIWNLGKWSTIDSVPDGKRANGQCVILVYLILFMYKVVTGTFTIDGMANEKNHIRYLKISLNVYRKVKKWGLLEIVIVCFAGVSDFCEEQGRMYCHTAPVPSYLMKYCVWCR